MKQIRGLLKACGVVAVLAPLISVQGVSAQDGAGSADQPLYFHPYRPALTGTFQLQPEQGFSIVEPFGGFVRMVQVCVRDAKSIGPMPVPTPMLAVRTEAGGVSNAGAVSVGSCAVLEGDSVAVGLADGTVDTDASDTNARRALQYMSGSYTILGYYSTTKPVTAAAAGN